MFLLRKFINTNYPTSKSQYINDYYQHHKLKKYIGSLSDHFDYEFISKVGSLYLSIMLTYQNMYHKTLDMNNLLTSIMKHFDENRNKYRSYQTFPTEVNTNTLPCLHSCLQNVLQKSIIVNFWYSNNEVEQVVEYKHLETFINTVNLTSNSSSSSSSSSAPNSSSLLTDNTFNHEEPLHLMLTFLIDHKLNFQPIYDERNWHH